jgi:hypothetical protein
LLLPATLAHQDFRLTANSASIVFAATERAISVSPLPPKQGRSHWLIVNAVHNLATFEQVAPKVERDKNGDHLKLMDGEARKNLATWGCREHGTRTDGQHGGLGIQWPPILPDGLSPSHAPSVKINQVSKFLIPREIAVPVHTLTQPLHDLDLVIGQGVAGAAISATFSNPSWPLWNSGSICFTGDLELLLASCTPLNRGTWRELQTKFPAGKKFARRFCERLFLTSTFVDFSSAYPT